MKNNYVKIFLFVLIMIICVAIGWYAGGKFADKEAEIIDSNNKETKETKEDSNIKVNSKQAWINYILDQNIKSIIYYNPILDDQDPNFKNGVPSFYTNELTEAEFKELLKTMDDSTIGLVQGMGGVVDYIEIKYIKNNKEYTITINGGAAIYTDDDNDFNEIMANEVKDRVANMSAEEKDFYGSNPVGNVIIGWSGSEIRNYFNKDTAKVYYHK